MTLYIHQCSGGSEMTVDLTAFFYGLQRELGKYWVTDPIFGAVGDGDGAGGGTENSAAINAAFAAARAVNGTVCFPYGVFRIDSPVWVTGSDGADPAGFEHVRFEGAGMGNSADAGTATRAATIIDHSNITDAPGFVIQAGRNVQGFDIAFFGPNDAPATMVDVTLDMDPDPAQWVTPGVRDSRYSPQCAIAIDPTLGNVPADGGYPGLTYWGGTKATGTVQLERVLIERSVVGVAFTPNDSSLLSDQGKLLNCALRYCRTGAAYGQGQTRNHIINGGSFAGVHTCVDTMTYGQRDGSPPRMMNFIVGRCFALFAAKNTGGEAPTLANVYTEGVGTLGSFGVGSGPSKTPLVLRDSTLNVGYVTHARKPQPYFLETHSNTRLEGCEIKVNYAAGDLGGISWALNTPGEATNVDITYDHCEFRLGNLGAATNPLGLISWVQDRAGPRARFISCTVNANGTRYHLDSDWLRRSSGYDQGRYDLPESAALLRRDDKVYIYVSPLTAQNYKNVSITGGAGAVTVDTVVGEVTFPVADTSYVQVGDLIPFNMQAQPWELTTVGHFVPALRVKTVNGNTSVVCDMLFDHERYQGTYAYGSFRVIPQEWAFEPGNEPTGDFSNNNATITNVSDTTHFRVGDWLDPAITGVPANARIIAKTPSTLTMNKNANATAVGVALHWGRWRELAVV